MDLQLAQLLINGIAVGCIIALAAVGLTLTYGILRLANFAHGDFMTLGAYMTLLANSFGLNLWLSMGVGAVATIAAVVLGEVLIWSTMRERRTTSTTVMIISIGLALFIRNGITLIWGGNNQRYRVPVLPAQEIFGLRVASDNLIVLGAAIVAAVGLYVLLQYTKVGKAMRAVADDIDLARVSGINVDRVILWTWVVAGGLAALGGSLYGLTEAVRPNMGWFLILPMFAAVILGGIGNPYGAIAGALMIGIAQEVSTYCPATLGELAKYCIGTAYKQGIGLIIMVLVLLLRPQGLFKGTL